MILLLDGGPFRGLSGVLVFDQLNCVKRKTTHSASHQTSSRNSHTHTVLGTDHSRIFSPATHQMTKGTSSFGKAHSKSHTLCRRCNSRSLHKQKHVCASCGYPSAKMRNFNWCVLVIPRRVQSAWRSVLSSLLTTSHHLLLFPLVVNRGLKAKRRRTTGSGRMAHLKNVPRRAKNGFRTGVATKKKAAPASA